MKGGLIKNPSQCEELLNYLRKHQSITAFQCYDRLGITQPAARVFELKEKGYDIRTERCQKKNKKGKIIRFVKYYLETAESE